MGHCFQRAVPEAIAWAILLLCIFFWRSARHMSPAGSARKVANRRLVSANGPRGGKPRPPRLPARLTCESVGLAARRRGQFSDWIRMEGAWWAASFVFHTLLMAVLMLVPHTVSTPVEDDAPSFEEAETDAAAPPPPNWSVSRSARPPRCPPN